MLTYYLTHGLPRVLKVVTDDKGCSEFESEIKITFIKIEIINKYLFLDYFNIYIILWGLQLW